MAETLRQTDPASGLPDRAQLGQTGSARFLSIDLVRGAVMVLMAIDHVRVYSGLPPGGPTPGIFFTRWITHFCAPAFIFLAGTSAFLYGRRHPDLPRFLLLRGLWLVLLELTVIRVAWTFNLDFSEYLLAGVIWTIGWCMVLMAGLVRLPVGLVGGLGVAIIALHNAVMPPLLPSMPDTLRKLLYTAFAEQPIGPLMVLYSIIPWIGVMAAGYAFGRILTLPPPRRDRVCLSIGLGCIALFLLLRGFNLYGDPRPWTAEPPMPAASLVPQHHQVPGFTQLPAHDPRTDDRAAAGAGAGPWRADQVDLRLRPSPVPLLCAPHPPDSRAGAAGLVRP